MAQRSILLVRTPGDDAVMQRIRAELRANGWRVIELIDERAAQIASSLVQLASEQLAMAAVRVDAAMGRIEIQIVRNGGNIEETLSSEGGVHDAQVMAFRTTEALRAHGLVVGIQQDEGPTSNRNVAAARPAASPEEASSEKAPSKFAKVVPAPLHLDERHEWHSSNEPVTRASARRLWLELAPALVASPGGLDTIWAAWVGARLELSQLLSLRVAAALPLESSQVNRLEGRASIATYQLGAGAEFAWIRRSYASAALGLGAAALVTTMTGQPTPGYSGITDYVTTAAPHAYSRFGVVLAPRWSIFAVPLIGVSIPEVAVSFDRRTVSTWGRPFLALALGLEVSMVDL